MNPRTNGLERGPWGPPSIVLVEPPLSTAHTDGLLRGATAGERCVRLLSQPELQSAGGPFRRRGARLLNRCAQVSPFPRPRANYSSFPYLSRLVTSWPAN